MAISNEERKILDDFIKENKNLLCSVLNELKDEVDPSVLSTITSTVRDFSTYQLDGEQYGKAKLVLAVIKKYVICTIFGMWYMLLLYCSQKDVF